MLVFIIVLFISFRLYFRIRRISESQRFVKWRIFIRIMLMTIVGIISLVTSFANSVIYFFDASGIILGSIISYYAIRTSTFEWRNDDWFYSQNPWINIFLLLLFVGRIACKAYQIYDQPSSIHGLFLQSMLLGNYSRDPFTAGILFILITYHVVYCTFLLRHAQQMKTK